MTPSCHKEIDASESAANKTIECQNHCRSDWSQPLHRLNTNQHDASVANWSATHSGRLRRDIVSDAINTSHLVRNSGGNAPKDLRREGKPKGHIP